VIQRLLTDTIYVQHNTPSWDGSESWSDRGSCKGYIRTLSGRERPSGDKPTQFVTHRAVLDMTTIPVYGELLRSGTDCYDIKLVNPHKLSGGTFQIVDCEVVT